MDLNTKVAVKKKDQIIDNRERFAIIIPTSGSHE